MCGPPVTRSYAVFRRSMRNPFFHPYFYDYGGDKMELFHRLHMIGGGRGERA